MKNKIPEITASTIAKTPNKLKTLIEEFGQVRIIWREAKPGGKVALSAIVKNEKLRNKENEEK